MLAGISRSASGQNGPRRETPARGQARLAHGGLAIPWQTTGETMKTIFVSGCYDILHAGHVQFFNEAKALGDHLTVCFASDEILWKHKNRRSSLLNRTSKP